MTENNPSEAEVMQWLRANPDFLTRHPDLIARLAVPHESGTTSLIERQVKQLRSENQQLRRQLDHLTGVAGENERLMQRLHRLALGLVATDSCDTLYKRLDHGLRKDFRADAICLMLDAGQAAACAESRITALPAKQPAWMEKLLASGEPQCGRLTREKRQDVFGEAGTDTRLGGTCSAGQQRAAGDWREVPRPLSSRHGYAFSGTAARNPAVQVGHRRARIRQSMPSGVNSPVQPDV